MIYVCVCICIYILCYTFVQTQRTWDAFHRTCLVPELMVGFGEVVETSEQWFSTCGFQSPRESNDSFTGVTVYVYQIFTLWTITIAKAQLWNSNENNCMVGSHHDMRNCIQGSSIGKVGSLCFQEWSQSEGSRALGISEAYVWFPVPYRQMEVFSHHMVNSLPSYFPIVTQAQSQQSQEQWADPLKSRTQLNPFTFKLFNVRYFCHSVGKSNTKQNTMSIQLQKKHQEQNILGMTWCISGGHQVQQRYLQWERVCRVREFSLLSL